MDCPVDPPAQDNDPGQCSAIVTYTTATATDNCVVDVETYSPNSGSPLPVGTTSVRFTAIDTSDNEAQCTFDIVIEDNEVRWFRMPNETD